VAEPDTWMRLLATIPLLHQPGEGWTYNTSSDVLGVLLARASGQGLPEYLAENLFDPLGMTDTGFVAPEAARDRFTT
jgi:CubicO group peptidase (beta-lactamase class C family)